MGGRALGPHAPGQKKIEPVVDANGRHRLQRPGDRDFGKRPECHDQFTAQRLRQPGQLRPDAQVGQVNDRQDRPLLGPRDFTTPPVTARNRSR